MSSNNPSNNNDNPDKPPSNKDDKGKGKGSSLLSRIQESASSLIQNSLTQPSGASLSNDLAQVLNSGNKASSSSTSTYAGQRGSEKITPGDPNDITSGMSGGGFRSSSSSSSSQNAADGRRDMEFDTSEFDSFQTSGSFFQSEDQEISPLPNSDKGKSREQDILTEYNHISRQDMSDMPLIDHDSTHLFSAYEIAWINASSQGSISGPTTSNSTNKLPQENQHHQKQFTTQIHHQTQNQDPNDGAQVIALLTNPSFQPGLTNETTYDSETQQEHPNPSPNNHGPRTMNFNNLDNLDNDDDDPLDTEGFPRQTLSPSELQIIDSFRQQEQNNTKKKISAYSLVPDIDSFLATSSSTMSTNDDVLRKEIIANLVGAEDWLVVDERYNDEVWGYLKPAVEAALAEIQENEQSDRRGKDDDDDDDGPAVKRLKMILRHMAH